MKQDKQKTILISNIKIKHTINTLDISGLNISAKNKTHQTNRNNYMLVIRSEVK